MRNLTLTRHMTTDEVVKLMESAIELTENEQILLDHLRPRINGSPMLKQVIGRLEEIEDEARSIVNMADEAVDLINKFGQSASSSQLRLGANP